MKSLPFYHRYGKLNLPQFTTIRGKTYAKKFRVGETIQLDTLDGPREVQVVSLELKRVQDIPLDVLKLDGEYPGFTIESHAGFVALLNSLRRSFMPQATLESQVTIITLRAGRVTRLDTL